MTTQLRDCLTSSFQPGMYNTLTDVPGVQVGHATLISGEGPWVPGEGPVRTGVTVVRPHVGNLYLEKVPAAVHTINGFGKPAGFEQVRELGCLEAPIALTNTLNVGCVLDALVSYSIRQNRDLTSVNVVVGETNDSYLNDIQGRHVQAEHVFAALESAAAGPVAEGTVGAGTGTMCYGWKGGIGTASRVLPAETGGFTLGALVQSNFGRPEDLVIANVPVGRWIQPPKGQSPGMGGRRAEAQAQEPSSTGDGGSIMIVLATDAPLDSRQLGRVCRRADAGLARTGSYLSHGSGDFVVAFSTAYRIPHRPPGPVIALPVLVDEVGVLNLLFRAVVETVEEAVLRSLFGAQTVTGRDGHTAHALPVPKVLALLSACHKQSPNFA